LESLEDRAVPATYYWVGASTGGPAAATSWSDPNNWDMNGQTGVGVPGAADVATFSSEVPAYVIPGPTPLILISPVNQTPVFDINVGGSVGSLRFDSTWTGDLAVVSPLTVTGDSEWDGGSITIFDGESLANTGSLTLNRPTGPNVLRGSGTLLNSGVLTQAGPGGLQVSGSGLVNQTGGTYVLAGDAGLTGTGWFANAGTLRKSTGTLSTIGPNLSFNNSGTLDVRQGTLAIAAGWASTGGTFNVQSGAVLDLTGGGVVSYSGNYVGTYTTMSPGTILLSSGTLRLVKNAQFQFPAGMWQWSGGTIDTNAYTLTNAGSLSLTNPAGTADVLTGGGTLSNLVTAVIDQTGAGGLALASAGSATTTLSNAGLYNLSTDSGIAASAGGGALVNTGSLQKTSGQGTSTVNPGSVSNVGAVFSHSGTLDLEGVVQVQAAGASLTAGTWGVESPAALTLNGGAAVTTSSATVVLAGPAASFPNVTGLSSSYGALTLVDGANFAVPTQFINMGTLTVNPGSSFSAYRLLNYPSGVVVGGGTITSNATSGPPLFYNWGQLYPSASAGTLDVFGVGLSQLPGSALNVQLNGADAGTGYSQLRVHGGISLAGALKVAAGFAAPVGSQFVIIQNDGSAAINGAFDGLPEGAGVFVGGQLFHISYHGGSGRDVVLTAGVPDPPTVEAVTVNDGSLQRSEVRSISVLFSGQVNFQGGPANAAAAFRLTNAVYGADVTLSDSRVSTDDSGRTYVTLHFFGIETDPVSTSNQAIPSLADGRYQLTVDASKVTGPDGVPLDGAGNGQLGTNYVSPPDSGPGQPGPGLYRLYGDVNGDGVVDASDLETFRSTFNANSSNPQFVLNLDANSDGVIDALDLIQFRSRFNTNVWGFMTAPQFYLNPATGNDANDGRSPQTAWATWARLAQAVADRTIPAGTWVTKDGAPAGLTTIPTTQNKDDWYAAYLAGDRQVTGGIVNIDTSLAPLQVTSAITMPPGSEIRSATDQLTDLRVNVPVASTEVWAQPDPVNDPDVWATTSATSYQATVLYEQMSGQWAQLLPIGYDRTVPNLAAALPLLEAAPGSFYVDPATNRLYTHAIAEGNPNTDGVGRQYVPPWATLGAARIVDVSGGLALRIGGDGGFGFDAASSQAMGDSGVGSGEWGGIAVIDSCTWSRAGKHTFSSVGNLGAGLVVYHNDVATQGPGRVFVGYWSSFVDYSAFTGTGSIVSIYDGCSTIDGWANVNAPGGSDADSTYTAILEHTNGNNTAYAQRILNNCVFRGSSSIGNNTAVVQATNCIFKGALSSDAATTFITGGFIGDHMPEFGMYRPTTATLTGVTIRPGTAFTGGPTFASGLGGSITLNNCTIDLTAGNVYSTAWGRSSSTSLTIVNSTILLIPNYGYGFVTGWLSSDSFHMTGTNLTGSSYWPLFMNYNNSNITLTWQWARDQGYIDGTNTLNGGLWAPS
jgi:hypothetical protein